MVSTPVWSDVHLVLIMISCVRAGTSRCHTGSCLHAIRAGMSGSFWSRLESPYNFFRSGLDFSISINIIHSCVCVCDMHKHAQERSLKNPRRPWRETGRTGSIIHAVRRREKPRHSESFQPYCRCVHDLDAACVARLGGILCLSAGKQSAG